jgi:hypothetical protein
MGCIRQEEKKQQPTAQWYPQFNAAHWDACEHKDKTTKEERKKAWK